MAVAGCKAVFFCLIWWVLGRIWVICLPVVTLSSTQERMQSLAAALGSFCFVGVSSYVAVAVV
ncbi:hypothetical protein FN846DRAFT_966078 [Sphaerosporella brunnea]|uniref:Uncharacterized protein n=1 Tax=Sphaerosporella brunnea TaxID=1250544 RepID=A0A5J5EM85_9PEZI|nr:hypothetical protein FN846DRAFT_966078 [Sphaerosporella brunnea]